MLGIVCNQVLKTIVSHVPANNSGSSSRPSIRAAINEVRGRRCPEIRSSTRWPFDTYPYHRAVEFEVTFLTPPEVREQFGITRRAAILG